MTLIGHATTEQILALKAKGLSPKAAMDLLLAEAKRRHPHAGAIVVQPSQGGFDFIRVG